MSIEEADRFIADLVKDPAKFSEFEQMAKSGMTNEVYEAVRQMGYDATIEELAEAFFEYATERLSEEDLASIAGGISDGALVGATAGAAVGAGVIAGGVAAGVVIATSSAAGAAAAI
jgi:predicted ribosomally synthesized peptide with nif11-like leader